MHECHYSHSRRELLAAQAHVIEPAYAVYAFDARMETSAEDEFAHITLRAIRKERECWISNDLHIESEMKLIFLHLTIEM